MSAAEQYFIKENKVFIPATKWYAERCIAEINESNKDYIIETLIDRFKGVTEKAEEVKVKFENTNDISKLEGFLSRTKAYICTAIAIGDYETVLEKLDSLQTLMKDSGGTAIIDKENICAEAQTLLDSTDQKEATNQMRELQRKFRELPNAYDDKSVALKNRFESINDEFYKRKKDAFDLIEKEHEENLAKKILICEKAEALQNSTDYKITTDAYLELNEEWKKIGFVPKHRKEELWLRFSTAKDQFFAKKKEHIGEIKVEQEENYQKKKALVSKAESLKESKDWKKTTDEYKLLMEEWKKIGRVPMEKSDEIWNEFITAQNIFFKAKDEYYSNVRVMYEDNYAKKMAIVQHAELLQETDNFETATKEFNDMFEEWKLIGRIPKEYGDEPWERFLAAKKMFFERKDAFRELRKKNLSKDIEERLSRDRQYYNKLSKELYSEERLIEEVQERIANLPTTLRSYEKREEYLESLEDIKANVEILKQKIADLKENMYQDEKELNYIHRIHHKKEHSKKENKKTDEKATVAAEQVIVAEEQTTVTTEQVIVAEEQVIVAEEQTTVAEVIPEENNTLVAEDNREEQAG